MAAVRPEIDTSVAHIARIQDYWLGGKDHFTADRIAGNEAIAALPDMVASVRNTRAFLGRTVRYLSREAGVRQFLDIGTGIPMASNTHEVAQEAAPEARIVYVDNDPMVLAHARALLTSHPSGMTSYVDADLRDVDLIVEEAAGLLDFRRPIAVVLMAVLQFIPDEDDPWGIVQRLMAAVPSGSYLVISHPASDIQAAAMAGMAKRLNKVMAQKVKPRSKDEVTAFFDGLELVEPGVIRNPEWRPLSPADAAGKSTMWGGVARKPLSPQADLRCWLRWPYGARLPDYIVTETVTETVTTLSAGTASAHDGNGGAAPRPVILTVDDDPGVSRAVARDLRRRYGENWRIVRAESGADALEALRQVRLRGDQVAVLLADYRMPAMSGNEFLEQAMDIFPFAKRVLLTAYADTNAAIDAINVVDLDHYLLKPWDPPEEKLYPVMDDMLGAWCREERKIVPETKLIGHRWSARSTRMREFLARNRVPYRWYPSDSPEGERMLAAAGQDGRVLPVVITDNAEVLVDPAPGELAARIGLSTMPEREFYDLIVIGGGPAGLGAAVYGASEGLKTVIVEKNVFGGQAGQSSRIENYLGFPDGLSGGDLTFRARLQAEKFQAEMVHTRHVTGLDVTGSARTVRFDDGTSVSGHAIILATGVIYRQLPAPGCDLLTDRGVYYGATLTQADQCVGQDVYVVGGANSAGQAAVNLALRGNARSVTMLVRAPDLTASMSYYLIEQISGIPQITVRPCTEVIEAAGSGHLERVTLRDLATGQTETVDCASLFVFIGAEPRTKWLDGVVARDKRGFVLTGPDLAGDDLAGWPLDRMPYHLETSVPGVFAAGDVRAESAKRVASAVGEGAMAVMLVHRYLEQL